MCAPVWAPVATGWRELEFRSGAFGPSSIGGCSLTQAHPYWIVAPVGNPSTWTGGFHGTACSVVTRGVRDLERSRKFYEERLGWRRANEGADIVFFQANGMVIALFPWDHLAQDAQVAPDGAGFRGVTLAYCTRSRTEVESVLAEAERAGGRIVKPAQDVFWGGHSGYFADPDGHLWEVAWNPDWTLDSQGNVSLTKP